MKKRMSLTKKILVGLILGALFGLILNKIPSDFIKNTIFVNGILKLVGQIFINSIKMLVVPLVFVSLVCGASAIGDVKKLGRVGVKTLGFYMATTAVAITLALVIAKVINPGIGLDLSNVLKQEPTIGTAKPLVEVITDMVPQNPIASLANGSMLQIIVFALFTGVTMALIREKAEPVINIFNSLNEIIMKMVKLIMLIAPYGVFALIAKTFATVGFEAMFPLLKYMLAVLLALLIHALFTYMGVLGLLGRLNPIKFFKNMGSAMSVAFSTASSSGTLPLTIETVEKKCGVSKNVASFTLPLGATINMDGTAIMQGVAVIFISQVYGIDLSIQAILTVIFTAVLASVGTAGVPGVGLITLSMVLTSVGLPVEGIALIIGIDRLLDMCRTVVNITGDAVCTIVVAKSEGEFDENVYYAENESIEYEGLENNKETFSNSASELI
ncbi:dicarboxylate/amino acid:cation symporter [Caldisalinibacter kiritimatiensis]|uniref:Proton/glutamate symport protein / Sodium/glutamate symport protein n=1 Tax=Caldisalinibacter kiritimatiensis TaxID=1304284 RepID=R1AWQ1_9FIRM|nr:dicarboxylate/amino acid:cation symporter [Caldisalinibacter kiritimatiensis]EOD01618.1 Proton/glutamate symport protein / Sodium/glutamate symport protein [Caldisalinibacter kiritimatiensis]